MMIKYNQGLDFRLNQVKRKTDIGKIMYKLPITTILMDAKKCLIFYGGTFEESEDTLFCNTKFIGTNYEKFINSTAENKTYYSKQKTD